VTGRPNFVKLNLQRNQVINVDNVHLKRRLSAIMLADVVGYSRLMSVDEEGTHTQLASHLNDRIEPKIAEYDGRVLRTMGDGLLVEFDSCLAAVRCAIEIQQIMARHNTEVDIDRRIELRIGINTGDVIVDDRDIYGNSVNIAARLEGLAEPGGIYITQNVYDQMRGYPNLCFEDKGLRQVKNIGHPIHVFRVENGHDRQDRVSPKSLFALGRVFSWTSLKNRRPILFIAPSALATILLAGSLVTWNDRAMPASRASLLVLPFANLSSDPEQDYFADALTEDLTTDLCQMPDTFVIARATAFTFKGKAIDVTQIGRELGVRYILQGSIRKIQNRIETNAQLIDAKSASHIWAERFENDFANIFELQNEITAHIASTLNIQLIKVEGRRALGASPNANDFRMRGLALIVQSYTPEHTLAARKFFQQAVSLDPEAGEAWSWLATVLASDYLNYWNHAGENEVAQADEAVHRALAINPDLAQAHFAHAYVLRAKGDHQAALVAFDRAITLNPNFALAYAQKGNQLTNLGQPEQAPPLAMKAITLSPHDPGLGVFYYIIGRANFLMKRYADAVPWLEKSVHVRPNLTRNRLMLISAYTFVGRDVEAHAALSDFQQRFSGYSMAVVEANDNSHPLDNPVAVAGLERVREGLRRAGMPER
jgi:adenylate cyclase